MALYKFIVTGDKLALVTSSKGLADTLNINTAEFLFKTSEWDSSDRLWAHFTCYNEDVELGADYKFRLIKDITKSDKEKCPVYTIASERGLNIGEGVWEVFLHADKETGTAVMQRVVTNSVDIEIADSRMATGIPTIISGYLTDEEQQEIINTTRDGVESDMKVDLDYIKTLIPDDVPTKDSTATVRSGGVYSAIATEESKRARAIEIAVNKEAKERRDSDYKLELGLTDTTKDLEIEILSRKTNDAAMTARMDTFTSLSAGSTTGDAELIDIRTDIKGVTHGSAGSAVRKQIEDITIDYIALARIVNDKYPNMFANETSIAANDNIVV